MTRDKLIRSTLVTLVATVVYKGLFALAHHPISWLLATMLGFITVFGGVLFLGDW